MDAIPFNFGDGSYNYTLKSNTDVSIAFGQGDWIVDPNVGVLTFYGTVPANMPPKITFYKYIGDKGVGGGSIASGGSGVENYLDSESANFEVSGSTSVGDWTSSDTDKVTITSSATTPLAGAASGVFTKLAVDAVDAYISVDSQTIARDRRGKPITIRMSVDADVTNYESEDVEVQLWDITGTPEQIGVSGEPKIKKAKGELILAGFPESTCSQVELRLVVTTDSATAASWAMKIDRISLGPDKAYPSVYRRSEVIDLSGDFSAGQIRVSRVGPNVNITQTIDAVCSSSGTPNAGITLPVWARPTSLVINVTENTSANIARVGVSAGGGILFRKRNLTGGALAFTSFESATISYTVEDTESPLISSTEALHKSAKFYTRGNDSASGLSSTHIVTWRDTNRQVQGFSFVDNEKVIIKQTGWYSASTSLRIINSTFSRIDSRIKLKSGSDETIIAVDELRAENGMLTPSVGAFYAKKNDELFVEVTDGSGSGTYTLAVLNANSHFSVSALPDLSVYGVYGKHEILSAKSNGVTITNNVWPEFVGNSLILTPGVWELTGVIRVGGTASVTWTEVRTRWGSENGDNGSISPAAIGGILSGEFQKIIPFGGSSLRDYRDDATKMIVKINSTTEIFLNCRFLFSSGSMPTNGTNVDITAKRLV